MIKCPTHGELPGKECFKCAEYETGVSRNGNAQRECAQDMDLRDYFAGQALISTLSHERHIVLLGANNTDAIKGMTDDCYLVAESMMKSRGE